MRRAPRPTGFFCAHRCSVWQMPFPARVSRTRARSHAPLTRTHKPRTSECSLICSAVPLPGSAGGRPTGHASLKAITAASATIVARTRAGSHASLSMPLAPAICSPTLLQFSRVTAQARADALIVLGTAPAGRRHVDNPRMHRSDHGLCTVRGLAVIYETTVVYIMPSPHRPLTAVYRCFLVTSDAVKSASDGALGHRRRKSTRRCTSTARIVVDPHQRVCSLRQRAVDLAACLRLGAACDQAERRRARTGAGSRAGRGSLRHLHSSLCPFDTTRRR
jgi:hypothetical protein